MYAPAGVFARQAGKRQVPPVLCLFVAVRGRELWILACRFLLLLLLFLVWLREGVTCVSTSACFFVVVVLLELVCLYQHSRISFAVAA